MPAGPGSGLTMKQLRSRVRDQATFADTDAVIDEWLNEKHKQLVAKSGWLTEIVTLASTVVGQTDYDLDANVVDLVSVTVAGVPYSRVGTRDLWSLRNGWARLRGGGFAPIYKADGTQQIALFPAPDAAGDAIQGLVTTMPADLSETEYPIVPEDFHESIGDGAIALGLRLHQESPDRSAEHEGRFQGAILELKGRKFSRVGSGPIQIGVKGYHF